MNKYSYIAALSTFFIVVAISPALAALVCPSCQYKTIASALNDPVTAGQTIQIDPAGSPYMESNLSVYYGHSLVSLTPGNPGAVVIDGGGALTPVIKAASGALIEGLTIKGGDSTGFGGGVATGGGSVVLRNLLIEGNHARSGGGGVGGITGGTQLTIDNCTIRNNTSDKGAGGVFGGTESTTISGSTITGNTAANGSGGGVFLTTFSTNVIKNTTISQNQATGNSASGGGIFNKGSRLTMSDVILQGNTVTGTYSAGGGIYMSASTGSPGNIDMFGGSVTGNSAAKGGGIVVGTSSGTVNISASVSGNMATNPTGSGGGIYCYFAQKFSLAGLVSSNTPDDIVGCGANVSPPLGVTRTHADNKQSGTSNDPVNTRTGELYKQYAPDINLGGPMPLYFARYYSSGFKSAGIFSALGYNWRHNFDWKLFIANGTINIVDHQGRTIQFIHNGAVWQLDGKTEIGYQLTENASVYTLRDPRSKRTLDFNAAGLLTRISDDRGNAHTLSYSGGPLTQVSDGLGRVLNFTYDSNMKLSSVDDGLGRSVSLAYTGDELTAVTDLNGNTTVYNYSISLSNRGLILTMVRPEGNAPFEHWYRSGDLKTVFEFDSSGNKTSFSYVNATDTTITDPLGNVRTHTHTATGGLSNNQDQVGQSLLIGYDAAGRRNTMTDKSGSTVANSYDPVSGELTTLTLPSGNSVSFSYASRIDSHGMAHYDQTGVNYPDGTSEAFTYDAAGNLTSHTDQRLNTRTFAYNAKGQRTQKINKLGGVSTYTYNADGTFATRADPFGNTTTFGYDAYKRLTGVTYADGTSRSYVRDTKGRLISETDERGNSTTMAYDGNDRVVSATNGLGSSTTFSYDGNDRLVSAADALGTLFSTGYDALGRVKTTTDGNGNSATMGYDSRGNLTSITDALGNAWSAGYDADGFITSTHDPLNNTLTFTRDARHRVTRRTSPLGFNNDIAYDLMSRIASTTDPLSNVTHYSYDANGQVAGVTLADGASTSYTRNALGQVTTLTDPNGSNWARSYDTMGRRTSVTDPLGHTTALSYDSSNRARQVTLPDSLGTLNLTYDAAGNTTQMLYSDGTNLAFSYDANGRATAANGLALTFDIRGQVTAANGIIVSYDAGGRLTSMELATGKTLTYSYDADNRLTQVADWTGGNMTFTYDAAGNRTSINRPVAHGVNTSYSYDNDNRLIGLVESGISSIYLTRNGKGQITSATRNVPQSASASTVASSVGSFDAASQVIGNSYDALGRRTAAGADSFVWDLASRLTSYTVAGMTVSNSYDAIGHRIIRAGAVTSTYIWNDALDLPSISIERRNGADFRYFVHTPAGQLLYSIDAVSGAHNFYHFDEMGNTLFVTDGAGIVIGSYAYSPFGELLASSGTLDNPFTWQGEYGVMDEGNGLYYLRARYYDSRMGRFISRDPKPHITPLTANPYQYAMLNPLLFIDPRGEKSKSGDFEDSMTDTVIGNATSATSYGTLVAGVVDNKTTPQVIIKGPLTVLKGTSVRKAVADALWDPPKDNFKLTKLNGGNTLDRLGGAADVVSAGATAYKTAERLNKVHEKGQAARLTALKGQALQMDEVVRLLEKGKISSSMADKLTTDIARKFDEENSGSLLKEVIDTKIEALVGFKETLVGLAGPIGDAADAFLGAIGFGDPENE